VTAEALPMHESKIAAPSIEDRINTASHKLISDRPIKSIAGTAINQHFLDFGGLRRIEIAIFGQTTAIFGQLESWRCDMRGFGD
jgi:hypothetical protein